MRDDQGVEFTQAHLEAILTTNALVKSIAEEQTRAREDRLKSIELLNQRIDKHQEWMEDLAEKSRDLGVRTAALEICGEPIPNLQERVTKLEWAWIKIAGFSTGLSILSGIVAAWIIVYLPRWLLNLKGGG
jgi:hypothetical protein